MILMKGKFTSINLTRLLSFDYSRLRKRRKKFKPQNYSSLPIKPQKKTSGLS
jgi:hypothetical protein